MSTSTAPAATSGTFWIGGNLPVHRIGFGTMQLTGAGHWGPPPDPDNALQVLRRAVDLGVNHFDTADAYGPCRGAFGGRHRPDVLARTRRSGACGHRVQECGGAHTVDGVIKCHTPAVTGVGVALNTRPNRATAAIDSARAGNTHSAVVSDVHSAR